MQRAGDLLDGAARRLAAAGVSDARREARLLLAHLLQVSPGYLSTHPEAEVEEDAARSFAAFIERRSAREPISHILGERDFWSLSFTVTADTLAPRPDSETLVEAALSYFPDPQARFSVLDLGTGTGCLLLSILQERPNATGLGLDKSPNTLEVARANAHRLGLEGRSAWMAGDWREANLGVFDLVISNPPYIPSGEIETLEPEVARYEPRLALDGGTDGLDAYRSLMTMVKKVLKPKGVLGLEFGLGQGADVMALMQGAGLSHPRVFKDLAGIERCLFATFGG